AAARSRGSGAPLPPARRRWWTSGAWPAAARFLGSIWRKRSEEHTSELQSRFDLVCRLLLEKKKKKNFGMKMLTMKNLSTECLIKLTKLGYDATPFNKILKQKA